MIDTSAGGNQTFTTSIYLNQSVPKSPTKSSQSSLIVNRKTSLPVNFQTKPKLSPSKTGSQDDLSEVSSNQNVAISSGAAPLSIGAVGQGATGGSGATSSVYLNQSSPTRHVTVIPINNDDLEDMTSSMTMADEAKSVTNPEQEENALAVSESAADYENRTYGAIFDFDEKTISKTAIHDKDKSRQRLKHDFLEWKD